MTAGPGALPPGQPPDALAVEVTRALTSLPPDASVVVAVSGGADSTALALLTTTARPDLAVTLAHVRHGLRDDAADRQAVTACAQRTGRPLVTVEVEVRPAGGGVEAAARTARYAALRKIAADVGASAILTGHTAEDQAETLLLRLARGTGVPGLAGMRPQAGDIVRPLLRLRRADVRAVAAAAGIATVDDPTNADPAVRRARARHETLPALGRLHPDPVGALTRLADLAADDAAALDRWAEAAGRRLVVHDAPYVAAAAADLASLPVAVARRVVRAMLWRMRGGEHPPTAAEVARVLDLDDGDAVDLAGARASRRAGRIRLGPPVDRGGGSVT